MRRTTLDTRLKALEDSARTGDRERIATGLTQVEREMERLTRVITPEPSPDRHG